MTKILIKKYFAAAKHQLGIDISENMCSQFVYRQESSPGILSIAAGQDLISCLALVQLKFERKILVFAFGG